MSEEVANWAQAAQYDLGTAEAMLKAGRYPVDLSSWLATYTEKVAREYLGRAVEVVEWIKEQLRS